MTRHAKAAACWPSWLRASTARPRQARSRSHVLGVMPAFRRSDEAHAVRLVRLVEPDMRDAIGDFVLDYVGLERLSHARLPLLN